MHEFNIKGHDIQYKTVTASKNAHSGHIYVPKAWHEKDVAVVLLGDD